jgi:DNA-binding NarL/FixJ family response regulator
MMTYPDTTQKIRLLLADDHELIRAGIRSLISNFENVEVVGEARSGHETLVFVDRLSPNIVLLDILMPGLNGLEVLLRIKKEFPEVCVIMLSMNSAEEYVLQAMRSGASGYLVKSDSPRELELAIRAVARGDTYLSAAVSKHVIAGYLSNQAEASSSSGSSFDKLTPRQREVLQLIAEGQSTKQIAATLGLSAKTIESHRTLLMRQLDIHDIASLVRYALNRGLVTSE